MGLARRLTAVIKVGLPIACFGMVALWSEGGVSALTCEFRDVVPGLCECDDDTDCELDCPPGDTCGCQLEDTCTPLCGLRTRCIRVEVVDPGPGPGLGAGPRPGPDPRPDPRPRPDPAKNAGGHNADVNVPPSDPGRFQGDPIDITTGNLVHIETDYVGAGPFPLVFRRTYNSQSVTIRVARLGANWSHSYSARIGGLSGLFGQISPDVVQVVRADGKVLRYRRIPGSPRWRSTSDTNSTLQSNVAGWRYTTGSGDVEIYDAAGKLLKITTRGGLFQDLQYDGELLKSVSDQFGRSLTLDYSGNRISKITDPAGGTYTYQYDNDNLKFVTGPDGKREYLYEDRAFPHALNGVIDENGVRFATFLYDSQGRAYLSQSSSDGVDKVMVRYATAISLTGVTDALGTARQYRHDMILGVKRTRSATKLSALSTWNYDGNGNIKSYTDYRGNRTAFAYDLARNLETSRIEGFGTPEQRTITTQWHPTLRLPEKITEPLVPDRERGVDVDRISTFVYDPDGKDGTESYTVADTATGRSRTWTFHYRSDGQIERIDGPRPRADVDDITTFEYDDKGRLKSRINALGHKTEITAYDDHGRPRMIKDPNGLITTLTYDARGRLKTHEVRGEPERPPKSPDRPRTPVGPDPSLRSGELTTYEYDAVGQLCKSTSPDGSFVRFTYDGAHRLVAITDSGDAPCLSLTPPKLANAIIYTLDKIGNPVEEQVFDREGRLARTHCRTVDPLNRLKSSGSAVPETGLCPRNEGDKAPTTTFEYDDNDNLVKVTDPLGHSTTQPWSYDALDRLVTSADLKGGKTVYGYDAIDRLGTVTDPENLLTVYGYDGLDNLVGTLSPDTRRTVYTPDEAGNTQTRVDARRQETTYIYDALNRVTDMKFSDGAVEFIYDEVRNDAGEETNGIGRLTQMIDGTGTTHWMYDKQGRVTRKTQEIQNLTFVTRYIYDASGRLGSITYPSGRHVRLDYTDGRVTAISAGGLLLLRDIEYLPFGPAREWVWGDEDETTYLRDFNMNGRVDILRLGGGRTREVIYDDAGRITGFIDTGPSPDEVFTFKYDFAGQLIEFRSIGAGIGATTTLELDANGNRQSLTSDQGTDVYTPNPDNNQLLSIAGPNPRTYIYDDAGNVRSDGVNQFEYEGRGRLIRATNARGSTQYLINGLGQRVAKSVGSRTTYFVYDEAGHLLGEYNFQGAPVQEHVYLDDMPVAVLERRRFFVYTDHLGTPRAITNSDPEPEVVWRWEGDPFGASPPNENSTFTYNLRFPGQYFDEETGLFHNYFRDYDPQTGRYIQADPVGLEGGINPYLYAEGNPLTFIDPYGLGPLNGSPYSDESTGLQGRNRVDEAFARWTAWQIPVAQSIQRRNLRMGIFAASIGAPIAAVGTAAGIGAVWTSGTFGTLISPFALRLAARLGAEVAGPRVGFYTGLGVSPVAVSRYAERLQLGATIAQTRGGAFLNALEGTGLRLQPWVWEAFSVRYAWTASDAGKLAFVIRAGTLRPHAIWLLERAILRSGGVPIQVHLNVVP